MKVKELIFLKGKFFRQLISGCLFGLLCVISGTGFVFAEESLLQKPEPSTTRTERVVLQLSWSHKFQFAGYYMAKEKGYYREAGFDVEIRERSTGIDSVKSVVSGCADYGVSQGPLNNEPIVVLAGILQNSPAVIVALESSGIRTLEDLAGKRVMNGSQDFAYEYCAMLAAGGIAPDQLVPVPHRGTIDDLVEGRADACMAYATDEPYELLKRNIPCVVFRPEEYGINSYAEILFTTQRKAVSEPERVEAFREASLRGWHYAMSHIDETIDLILRAYTPEADRKKLAYEASILCSLMERNLVEIGYVNPDRWKRMMMKVDTIYGNSVESNLETKLEAMLFQDTATHSSRRFIKRLTIGLVVALGAMGSLLVLTLVLRQIVKCKSSDLLTANEKLEIENRELSEIEALLRLQRDFSLEMSEVTTLEDCLNVTLGYILCIPTVDCCGVYLANEATGTLELATYRGVSEAFATAFAKYENHFLFCKEIAVGRNVLWNHERIREMHDPVIEKEGLQAIIIVPIMSKSQAAATLHISTHVVSEFSAGTINAVESLASRLGGVLTRLQVDKLLQENESLFRTVAEGAFDAISLTDLAGNYRYLNRQFTTMTGYTEEALLGKSCLQILYQCEWVRGIDKDEDWLALLPVPLDREVLVRRKDATFFLAEISVKRIEWRSALALLWVFKDISERKRLEFEILAIDEWARTRIGHDLHDSIGQQLVGMTYLIEALGRNQSRTQSEQVNATREILNICRTAHSQLRSIVQGLLPLAADESLADGLKRLCENATQRMGVLCEFHDGCTEPIVDPMVANHLYCIAQEALANAVRHADAQEIIVSLEMADHRGVLRIDDNGCGFDLDETRTTGSGLNIMKYRADVLGGTCSVVRRATGGMSVRCIFEIHPFVGKGNNEKESETGHGANT